MIANHIHHALEQVRELQQKILEKQRFKGYSGRARAISGTMALFCALLLASPYVPGENSTHLFAWGTVFCISVILNFGAILYWFLFDSASKRDIRLLKPLLDVLPPLFVGGVLTFWMIFQQLYSSLFGMWMCLFGLANLSARHVLPKPIWILGLYYIVCGIVMLFLYPFSFLNPWPMGLVFFIGEWAGGIILHFDGSERVSFSDFFLRRKDFHVKA
jgi:hypothetical protein